MSELHYLDYEKLGVFYLGRSYDRKERKIQEDLVLYDAKDLTTHGVIVGMTGSGKTGLSVALLEEAALDGIPALVIDPKGDLGNLLLTFPELRPADFEPWVDPAEAARKGQTPSEYAASVAELWRRGLADWGQDGRRIARFRDSVDISIYTPGSSAGLPMNVLRSFGVPSEQVLADSDALRERVEGAVAGLLAMLGIDADPVQSREHILLANLLHRAWSEGRDLDLGQLTLEIQKPPFDRLGVIDLETFYPAKDRMRLAISINSLLASPGFAAWLDGESLDVGRLLYRPDGRPRISIVSIAHLSDAERMFIVTLLLNETLSWMRAQSGTSSLRALLYMDEIFGFFPPTAAPPSKKPMLTLLKQARAYGLGVLLATQNPVDLDYKGLSNCGTWFIGRLQTKQDKERVLGGLESASRVAGQKLDRRELEQTIGSLGKRVFLMNNVHEDAPMLFHTRWVMSYLRGPLVRQQIEKLMADRRNVAARGPSIAGPEAVMSAALVGRRPVLPEEIEEAFLPALEEPPEGSRLLYRPQLLGVAQMHFKRLSAGVDEWKVVSALAPIGEGARRLDWEGVSIVEGKGPKTRERPLGKAGFAPLPGVATRPRSFGATGKKLASLLYRSQRIRIWSHPKLKLQSRPGESEGDFRRRVTMAVTEKRDLEIEKLRGRYGARIESLEKRIGTAQGRIERERSQLRDRKLQTALSFGASVLGALMGRKKLSMSNVSRAGRAIRDVGRSRRETDDVERAEERLEELAAKKAELEEELHEELDELRDETPSAVELELEGVEIPPLKTDISLDRLALVWAPWAVSPSGTTEPLYELG